MTTLLVSTLVGGWYYCWYRPTQAALSYYAQQHQVVPGDQVGDVQGAFVQLHDGSFEFLMNGSGCIHECTRSSLKIHEEYSVDQMRLVCVGAYRDMYAFIEYVMRSAQNAVLVSCDMQMEESGMLRAECILRLYVTQVS